MSYNKGPITKEQAYDLLSGTIIKALSRGIGKCFGSDFEKGQICTVKNLAEIVAELNDRIIKEEVKK